MAIVVNCPACSRALSAPDEARGKQVRCTACGCVFEATAAPPAAQPAAPAMPSPAAPTQPPYVQPTMQQPYVQPAAQQEWQPPYGDEVYSETFNPQACDPALVNYWRSWRPTSFSTAGAILIDIVTCGIFGLIYYGLKFGELPRASRSDFGAGQAIGFSFIPYFAYYWQFRFWLGLCDRLNLQLKLRGMNQLLLPRGLAMTACILHCCVPVVYIPYLGLLLFFPIIIGFYVCREIFIGKMQSAINAMSTQSSAPGFGVTVPVTPMPQ